MEGLLEISRIHDIVYYAEVQMYSPVGTKTLNQDSMNIEYDTPKHPSNRDNPMLSEHF